jgi:MFS family permease
LSRNAAARVNGDLVAALTATALFGLALGIATVALPLLAVEEGYSTAEVGVLTAASALAQVCVRPALGAAMSRWPDWVLVSLSGVLLAASCGLLFVSTLWAPFLAAQAVQGAARACFWTGSQTHAVRRPGSAVDALARVNLASAVGLVSGPVIGGALSERSAMAAVVAAGLAGVLATVPTFAMERLPPFAKRADRSAGALWRQPGVAAGCWASGAAGGWRGLLSSYVPVALDAARQSGSRIGLLVSLANAATVVGAALLARMRVRGAFAGSTVLAGGGLAVLALWPGSFWVCAVALGVSGLAAGALQTLGPAAAAEAVHAQDRGRAIAATGTFRASAMLGAPLAVAGLLLVAPLGPAMAAVALASTAPAVLASRSGGPRGPAVQPPTDGGE